MAGTAIAPTKAEDKRVTRREPLALFDAMQDEMERWWGRMAPFGLRPLLRRDGNLPDTWSPRMDVYEQNGNLMVKAELPGVQKADVSIELEGGDLIVRGERKAESEVKEEDYYRMERSYGSFYRRLPLPFEVQADTIAARFADGVLEVTIPKPATTPPTTQTIPVE